MDALAEAVDTLLAVDGLWLAVLGATLGGLARGFSGFGTAMIYMPFASRVLPPVWALTAMVIFDLLGPLPNVPRALRDGEPREVARLLIGATLALPVGIWVLTWIDPTLFRWVVSALTLALLALVISGWRFHGRMSRPLLASTGALSGFLAGVCGLAGPPVILLYMSSRRAVALVRANIILFLIGTDILTLAVLGLGGLIEMTSLVFGLAVSVPFLAANWLGAILFAPRFERAYRLGAYGLIAASAVMNLPMLD